MWRLRGGRDYRGAVDGGAAAERQRRRRGGEAAAAKQRGKESLAAKLPIYVAAARVRGIMGYRPPPRGRRLCCFASGERASNTGRQQGNESELGVGSKLGVG